jgi:hypothetical protein
MTDYHALATLSGLLLLVILGVGSLVHRYWLEPYIDRTTPDNSPTE